MYGGTIPAQTWHDFMVRALEDVPVTDFNEPAPIEPVQDRLKTRARQGIDPGPRRNPTGTPADCGGPCEQRSSEPIRITPTTTAPAQPPTQTGP